MHLIDNCNQIDSGCYNAGFENISILDIAHAIREKVKCDVKYFPLMTREVIDRIQVKFSQPVSVLLKMSALRLMILLLRTEMITSMPMIATL